MGLRGAARGLQGLREAAGGCGGCKGCGRGLDVTWRVGARGRNYGAKVILAVVVEIVVEIVVAVVVAVVRLREHDVT